MKTILTLVTSCILLLSQAPSLVTTKIYHNDTSNIDDGEIWGSSLNLFFIKDTHIMIINNTSLELHNELNRIKTVLRKGHVIKGPDYQFYDYAFIINARDTLFADRGLETWRCKNKSSKIYNKVSIYVK